MKKIAVFFAAVFAATIVANAQTLPAEVQESMNNRIARDNSSQSNVYYSDVVLSNGMSVTAFTRVQTGLYMDVAVGGDYTVGVFSPIGEALIGYRFTKGDVAVGGALSKMERNEADKKIGEDYLTGQVFGQVAISIAEDKSGDYLGDWRLSLVGRVGAQTFRHDKDLGQFQRLDGKVDNQEIYQNGLSFKAAAGLMAEIRLSKANANFLTIKAMANYTNDPVLNGQKSQKVGGSLTVGFKHVFGKKHYTSYGKVLKEQGALNARINASRSKANSL